MVGVDVNVAECRSDCTLNDDDEDEENEKGRTVSRRSAADDDDAGKAGDGKHAAVDKCIEADESSDLDRDPRSPRILYG